MLSGPGGALWNSLLAKQGTKTGSLGRGDSRKQVVERHNSKNSGLGRQDSRSNTLGRQGSKAAGLGRQGSQSNGLGRQESRTNMLGRQESRSNNMQRQSSRGGFYEKKSHDSCSLHPEPWEEIAQNAMGTGMGGGAAKSIWDSLQKEKLMPRQESKRSLKKQSSRKEMAEPFEAEEDPEEGWGGHLWNSLQPESSRAQMRRQDSKGSGLVVKKESSGSRGVTRQDSRTDSLQKRSSKGDMLARQGSRGAELKRQESRAGNLRKQGSQNGILRREDSQGRMTR